MAASVCELSRRATNAFTLVLSRDARVSAVRSSVARLETQLSRLRQ